MFENSFLRNVYGPKREEIIEGWRTLCNEDLYNFLSWPNIVRVIKLRGVRWSGHAARMGEKYIQFLYRNTLGMRPLGRFRPIFKDNIKMDLKEIMWEGVH
jgi:hypothetical protein